MKKRKEELVNGNRSLIKGIYVGNMSSNYQKYYKREQNKYPFTVKNDFYTSG